MAKKPAQPDKPGRKTAYSPKTDEIAYEVCRQFGADDRQLALVLGVSRATVNSWKKQHPTFRAQLLAGKEIFDTGVVEQKLLARAMGYDFDEKTFDVPGDLADQPKRQALEAQADDRGLRRRRRL